MRTPLCKRHQYLSFKLWRQLIRNPRSLSLPIRSPERIRCRICNRAQGRKCSALQWMIDLSSPLKLPLLAEKIIKRKRRKEEIRPTSTSESQEPPRITTTRWMIWAGASWEVSQKGTTFLIQTTLWTIKAQICTWESKIRLARPIHSNSSKMRAVQSINKVSQTQWTASCQIQATAKKITCLASTTKSSGVGSSATATPVVPKETSSIWFRQLIVRQTWVSHRSSRLASGIIVWDGKMDERPWTCKERRCRRSSRRSWNFWPIWTKIATRGWGSRRSC